MQIPDILHSKPLWWILYINSWWELPEMLELKNCVSLLVCHGSANASDPEARNNHQHGQSESCWASSPVATHSSSPVAALPSQHGTLQLAQTGPVWTLSQIQSHPWQQAWVTSAYNAPTYSSHIPEQCCMVLKGTTGCWLITVQYCI